MLSGGLQSAISPRPDIALKIALFRQMKVITLPKSSLIRLPSCYKKSLLFPLFLLYSLSGISLLYHIAHIVDHVPTFCRIQVVSVSRHDASTKSHLCPNIAVRTVSSRFSRQIGWSY